MGPKVVGFLRPEQRWGVGSLAGMASWSHASVQLASLSCERVEPACAERLVISVLRTLQNWQRALAIQEPS